MRLRKPLPCRADAGALTLRSPAFVIKDGLKRHARGVDHQLAFLGEVHGDAPSDVALHLPHTPFGKMGVDYTHTGSKYGTDIAHLRRDIDGTMGTSNLNLAGLIGSRICHDLISPIGAIGNGLELLEMRGVHGGLELDLIARSAVQARARIAFYRLAFGHGGDDLLARREIVPLLDDLLAGGRIVCDWQPEDPCPRAGVRLALLAFMCCETALPYGGTVRIAREGDGWRVVGEHARLQIDPALWLALAEGRVAPDVAPAHVQFALLPEVARDQGRRLAVDWDEGSVRIGF